MYKLAVLVLVVNEQWVTERPHKITEFGKSVVVVGSRYGEPHRALVRRDSVVDDFYTWELIDHLQALG